jgi:3-hydroxyisobutyrate dehydrogenase-like beta-hydroxyacid dehydrogenase
MTQTPVIGIVGLGIMGGAYAKHLCAAGRRVVGYDVDEAAKARLADLGGSAVGSPAEVAREADILLLALPSVKVLEAVTDGEGGLLGALKPGAIVCEMSTFPLDAKERMAQVLAADGAISLDCPVSGTGAQAAVKDLVVYASGDEAAVETVRPVFGDLGREVWYVGEYGAGMKLKFVANLLVTIHNVAAAEAMFYAERAGLDQKMVYDAISSGAGTSRMFEVRAPLMMERSYEPATMKNEVYVKDLQLIMDHAREVQAPVPLMAASLPYYFAALAAGRQKEDTAAVYEVLRDMSRQ